MPEYPNTTHVSPHLTWQELACHDAARTPYPEQWRTTRAVALAKAFELVREACGGVPLHVLSGYRTPAHNKAIGGATLSQHCEGRAVDVYTPRGMSLSEFLVRIKAAIAAGAPIRGRGRYPWGYHIDVRPTDHPVVWRAQRSDTVR